MKDMTLGEIVGISILVLILCFPYLIFAYLVGHFIGLLPIWFVFKLLIVIPIILWSNKVYSKWTGIILDKTNLVDIIMDKFCD